MVTVLHEFWTKLHSTPHLVACAFLNSSINCNLSLQWMDSTQVILFAALTRLHIWCLITFLHIADCGWLFRYMYEVQTMIEHWWVLTPTSLACIHQTVLRSGTTNFPGSRFPYTQCRKRPTTWVHRVLAIIGHCILQTSPPSREFSC